MPAMDFNSETELVRVALSRRDVRIILKALDGPSVTDPDTARLYERLQEAMPEETAA